MWSELRALPIPRIPLSVVLYIDADATKSRAAAERAQQTELGSRGRTKREMTSAAFNLNYLKRGGQFPLEVGTDLPSDGQFLQPVELPDTISPPVQSCNLWSIILR